MHKWSTNFRLVKNYNTSFCFEISFKSLSMIDFVAVYIIVILPQVVYTLSYLKLDQRTIMAEEEYVVDKIQDKRI